MIQQEENEDSGVFITCVMEAVSVERINYWIDNKYWIISKTKKSYENIWISILCLWLWHRLIGKRVLKQGDHLGSYCKCLTWHMNMTYDDKLKKSNKYGEEICWMTDRHCWFSTCAVCRDSQDSRLWDILPYFKSWSFTNHCVILTNYYTVCISVFLYVKLEKY